MDTNPALKEFTYHRDVVSLASRVTSPGILVNEKLPGFVASAKSFFQNLVQSKPDFHVMDIGALSKSLSKNRVHYTDIAKMTVYVPSGVAVSYPEWLSLLEDMAKTALTLEERVLDPFLGWVGLLVSDDSRFMNRRVKEGLGKTEFADLERHKKDLANALHPRIKDERPYGEMLDRNKDWEALLERINRLNERTARQRPEVIHEKTQTLMQYLQSLSDILSDPDMVDRLKGEYGKMFNKDIVQTLANMTYDVAMEVEFYAAYVFYLESTTQAIQDTQDKFKKQLKL